MSVPNFLFVMILVLGSFADQKADLVDPVAIQKLGVPAITENIYSGYLPVNTDETIQFHYYFAEVAKDDPSLPVTLWLNGGPGCSSAQGLFNENGPFYFQFKTDKLFVNENSWTKASHMLYLESPINVGYSYGPDPMVEQTDETTAQFNLQALISWFERFTQYQGREFYISGESYAGVYIPTLASHIIDYNNSPNKKFTINLKGLLIGNGCTHPTECGATWPTHEFNYYGGQGMISPQSFKAFQQLTEKCESNPEQQDCSNIIGQCLSEIQADKNLNPYNVYGECPIESLVNKDVKKFFFEPNSRNGANGLPPCADGVGLYSYLRNNKEFKAALHVDTEKSPEWDICGRVNYGMDSRHSYYLYPKLIQSGLRIWKYSGDADAVVPITGTLYWINQLQNEQHLRTIVQWRPWFVDGALDKQRQVGGNYLKLDGLSFVSVKGAGHMVPTDQRAVALAMFQYFLKGNDLPEQ